MFRQSFKNALTKQLKGNESVHAEPVLEALSAIEAIEESKLRGPSKELYARKFHEAAEKMRVGLFGISLESMNADITPKTNGNVMQLPTINHARQRMGTLDAAMSEETNIWQSLLTQLGEQVKEIDISYRLQPATLQRGF